ncbi:hypothetical protein ZWY2020_048528 [Hordeum vulgare]|nr:hypothetical protein ZWY2020_048528 [Hordeum vulgare]
MQITSRRRAVPVQAPKPHEATRREREAAHEEQQQNQNQQSRSPRSKRPNRRREGVELPVPRFVGAAVFSPVSGASISSPSRRRRSPPADPASPGRRSFHSARGGERERARPLDQPGKGKGGG